jgi:hypothetical protein
MRRKPVTRDEIRFNGSRITTLPSDSVREGEYHPEAIKALWEPLLRELNRVQQEKWDSNLGVRKNLVGAGWRGGFKKPEPITCPRPDHYYGTCTCQHCGGEFWRVRGSGHLYSSDKCVELARRSRMVAARSEARAAARAGRTCQHCGKPIEAQRSTRRYCSDHCRVTAHRAQHQLLHSAPRTPRTP